MISNHVVTQKRIVKLLHATTIIDLFCVLYIKKITFSSISQYDPQSTAAAWINYYDYECIWVIIWALLKFGER